MFATRFIRWSYKNIAKPYFFRRDPEEMHDALTRVGKKLGDFSITRFVTAFLFDYKNPILEQTILGIHFSNPIGLAAGWDKNALLTQTFPSVGFGFEEVGSITGEPCEGNPKPRLWRLPKSKSIVVYYGLKNDGCETVAKRLSPLHFSFPLGINIAKTNDATTVDLQAGIADYCKAFKTLIDVGHYFTINISCPNAFGGEPFTSPERLDALLSALDTIPTQKPLFLKMPVDLSTQELDALVAVAGRHRVHGFIMGNLTKKRDRPEIDQNEIRGLDKGGISGKPEFKASNELITHLYKTTQDKYVIIGCGGIFSAEDAYEKIKCGASLLQLITGMLFEGPQLIGEINKGLVELLKRDGYKTIQEAVGKNTQ